MSGFNKFVLAAVLAVGGIAGTAVIDHPALGTASARADGGVKYFTTRTAAENFAARARKLGYFTTVLETESGLYMVEFYSKHG